MLIGQHERAHGQVVGGAAAGLAQQHVAVQRLHGQPGALLGGALRARSPPTRGARSRRARAPDRAADPPSRRSSRRAGVTVERDEA
jgi:hypothetical protein